MAYWLMKSEPNVYSIDDLKRDGRTIWDGVRNYQARNFLQQMRLGERAFFYHSNADPPGIFGLMEITQINLVDPTQFDPNSSYYDPKSSRDQPRWWTVEVGYLQTCVAPLTLADLRQHYKPDEFLVIRPGNRLSVLPVPLSIALDIADKTGLNV
ncbi:EVE domain-containing protein [Synechococcus sp. C9]|uniref:EVE domain-containing protein n=1 Tax=Synechococcus sp. C9 TaxID=102119 RepID=UPI001FF6DB0A|nr:EVE domain-containing protein [Synechococcus sp. C9]